MSFKVIVVGTDGSETAGIALQRAAELAKEHAAELHVVSGYEPVQAKVVASGAGGDQRGWHVPPDARVTRLLEAAAFEARARGVEATTHACDCEGAEAILNVAEREGADLIVVGSRGMTGSRRFLLGSVPNKISHNAECDVLIVRTH